MRYPGGVSLVHYEPDIAVVPCLGCNELVDADDLVRSDRVWSSTIFWYPYHFWCIREGATTPCSLLECAECGAGLDVIDVCTVLHWAATFLARVRRRLTVATISGRAPVEDPAGAFPRPPGLRCVSVGTGHGRRVPLTGAFDGDDLVNEELVAGWFELAHDDCPDVDGWWAAVRGAPADDELRLVYADWLEERGEVARAEVVRLGVERRQAAPAARGPLTARLREARRVFRGSWIRDVCAAPPSGGGRAGLGGATARALARRP
jgi:uncharacterized protein (TIGR02996 family)